MLTRICGKKNALPSGKAERSKQQMEENRLELNNIVPIYARVHAIKLMPEEFEKTPKKSIKRFLYMDYPV